jgi:hypothetical protein
VPKHLARPVHDLYFLSTRTFSRELCGACRTPHCLYSTPLVFDRFRHG